ncbi:4-hydroxy-tetrahydrodipicolinate reductase [Salinisphaera orenii]|uniref:4-hydroxy-tetrahydrodipicolinate reductase n=1 Tax=Salinisphaera orenii YIM 95161 TaxID=1051139 RepID=A0A423Q1V2_9GAMM|nr:4-hydroxy-tetrahydrodipicolinate reductase [Salinisphaera halophila]ROO32470.1 dihydrodipicolinate reductase [Salinisphaera halophila YIM 95161]
MAKPVKVAINGAAGRMGRELVIACLRNEALALAAAFEAPGSEAIGRDAGRLAGADDAGVAVDSAADRGDRDFDVLVDFTRPEPCVEALDDCVAAGAAIVIGTTGFDDTQLERIDAAAERIALVMAPNFSAGVNLSLKLLEMAAKALGDSFDIEVLEAHHRHKVDAPSGTALRMGEVLAEATGRELSDCAVYARQGHTGERERGTIGFQTLRGGDIVGEHTVLFAGDGERLEITHKASSRQTFAGGAMRAAGWAASRPPGRYDMNDVLGIAERAD